MLSNSSRDFLTVSPKIVMNLAIFITCLVFVVQADLNVEDEWTRFKLRYGKTYADIHEEQYHLDIFRRNLEDFQEHNEKYTRGESTYRKGINQFSDVDLEEPKATPKEKSEKIFLKIGEDAGDVPDSIDWRDRGAVSEVTDTAGCTSGTWAFAAIGAIESKIFIQNGTFVPLSPQSLIDCDSYDGGCEFGTYETAFEYIRHSGVSLEEEYPYSGVPGECSQNVTYVKAKSEVFSDDEEVLWGLVGRFGPVAVEIDGYCLYNYASGIIDEDCGCTNVIRYQVFALVVGYGSENGTDYWILKNFWGKHWGEDGYFRLKRNGPNTCGIVTMPYYLIVEVD